MALPPAPGGPPGSDIVLPFGARIPRPDLPRVLLLLGVAATMTGRAAMGMIASWFTDDAYFYAVLARNLAAGHGWTFDGVTTTNGAHPLLLALETLLAWCMGPAASPLQYYRALVLLFAVVFLVFLAVVAWLTRPSAPGLGGPTGLAVALALGVLSLPGYLGLTAIGMESSLALPLAVVFFLLWVRERDLAAGLVGAALALARLDTVEYFLLPFALVRALSVLHAGGGRGRALACAARLLAPSVALLAAYAGFNLAVFGHASPINVVLKSSFPVVHLQLFQLLGPPGPLAARLASPHAQCLYIFAAAAIAWAVRGRFADAAWRPAVALLLACLLSQVNFVLFQKWSKPTPEWYLWPCLLSAVLASCLWLARAVPRRALAAAAAALGLWLGYTGALDTARFTAHVVRHAGEQPAFWRARGIDFLRAQPKDELWAATDCGRLSFWSERRFVDVDGLISGFELQDRIGRGEFRRYLAGLGVTRVLAYAWDRPQTAGREYEPMYRSRVHPAAFRGDYDVFPYYVYSYRHMAYSDTLLLRRDQESWRSEDYRDGLARGRAIAFDLRR